jgi:hypothetical protein
MHLSDLRAAVMDFYLHGPDSVESEPVLELKMSANVKFTSLDGQMFI